MKTLEHYERREVCLTGLSCTLCCYASTDIFLNDLYGFIELKILFIDILVRESKVQE